MHCSRSLNAPDTDSWDSNAFVTSFSDIRFWDVGSEFICLKIAAQITPSNCMAWKEK